MSKGFSAAQVKGTLGRDPEVRSTPSGAKVVNFSVAVERGFGDKLTTDWHNIVAWGALAEFVERYLKKGKSIYVTGELQVRSWDDKQTGAKRTVTEIKADRIEFADSGEAKSGAAHQERSSSVPPVRQQATSAPRSGATDDPFQDEDSIPF